LQLSDSCKVLHHVGPWSLSGAWWTPHPFRRNYWDLEVEGPLLLRVFHDLHRGRWWLDGLHD
jgi:hypothetical protein